MKEAHQTVCFFCSLGCGLTVNRGEDRVHYQPAAADELEYQLDNPINKGSLCGKCNYIFEILYHPERIQGPQMLTSSGYKNERWDTAISGIADNIAKFLSSEKPESIGILVSPNLTVEETELALQLAKIIGTPHIDYCSLEDKPLLQRLKQNVFNPKSLPSVEEIGKMRTCFIVGDLFGASPVLSRHFLKAKYEQRGNRLIVLESTNSHTGWFANLHLRTLPGTEAIAITGILKYLLKTSNGAWKEKIALALESIQLEDICKACGLSAEELQTAAGFMQKEKPSLIALTSGFGLYDRMDVVTDLCLALSEATDSSFLPALSGANSMGICETLGAKSSGGMSASQMIEAAEKGNLKCLLNFGVDIVRTSMKPAASAR